MPRKHIEPPANDNIPPSQRRVVNALTQDLPITEHELALVEIFLADIIEEMVRTAVNDNGVEAGRESEP